MSNNWYGHYEVLDPENLNYYDNRVHLGQSAWGWEFMFQANLEEGITGIQSWLRQLDTFEKIRNTHGQVYTLDDFLEFVEARVRDGRARGSEVIILQARDKGPRSGYYDSVTRDNEWRDDGCFFANYSFR